MRTISSNARRYIGAKVEKGNFGIDSLIWFREVSFRKIRRNSWFCLFAFLNWRALRTMTAQESDDIRSKITRTNMLMKLLSLSASPTMPLSSSSSSNIFVRVGDLWFCSWLIHNATLKPCELNPSVFLPSSFVLPECNRSFFTKTHNWKLFRNSTQSEQVIQNRTCSSLTEG